MTTRTMQRKHPHARARELPTVWLRNKQYTLDQRLRELRDKAMPWENVKFDNLTVEEVDSITMQQGNQEWFV